MKRKIHKYTLLIFVALTFSLSACNAMRLDSPEEVAANYQIEELICHSSWLMTWSKIILDDAQIDNNYKNTEEMVRVYYGVGTDTLNYFLFIPDSAKYDVIVMVSPYPDYEVTLDFVDSYNDYLTDPLQAITYTESTTDYEAISSLTYLGFDRNNSEIEFISDLDTDLIMRLGSYGLMGYPVFMGRTAEDEYLLFVIDFSESATLLDTFTIS